jgi:Flp pilus assembly protein TadG
VLPTLLLIVLATIDLSRMAHASYAMSNALRAGAEVAATKRFTNYSRAQWESEVRAAVQEHLQHSLGEPAGAIQIDLTTTPVSDDMQDITLEATLPLAATADWPGFGGTYVMSEQLHIRQFR